MKKIFNDVEVVTFRCSKLTASHLKRIAMSYTKQQGKLYTLSDLIRDTMNQVFPMPKQLDLLNDNKNNKPKKSKK